MVAKANYLQLKVKEDTKLSSFLDWYEEAKSSVSDTGRNRKGNYKKFLLEQLELMMLTGEVSKEFLDTIKEFKESALLPPELQAAKKNLNQTDFAKFVELLEKAKSGAVAAG